MTDYYVDPVDGNDANAGTSEGSGNAWKTLGKAATVTVAGDTVWCKNNADYAEQLTITVLGNGGNPITWIGYGTTPGDGGKATITGSSSRSYCVIGSNESYYTWINFIFRDSTNNLYNDAGADWVTFHNCDFINGYSAISIDNSCVVVNCTFQNNGNYPITADLYLCCINNYFTGAVNRIQGDGSFFAHNVINNCGSTYATFIGVNSNGSHVFLNNTLYDTGNGAIALQNSSGATCVHINNLIQGFATGHWTSHASNVERRNVMYNNLHYDTTTIYGTDADPSTYYDPGDVSGDPGLGDPSSDDFSITGTSPAAGAGAQYRTS